MEALYVQLSLPESLLQSLHLDLLARLLLAAVLGGMVGMEREISGKPAGLRTNLLICVGAALLMEISLTVAEAANLRNVEEGVVFRADPARIAAQIVSGIGFLGAGTILQSRGNITGLTTAATIWVVAAIGMAVGTHAYVEAVGSTLLVVVSLTLLGRVERAVVRGRSTQRYLLTLAPDPDVLATVEEVFYAEGLRVVTESVEKHAEQLDTVFEVSGSERQHGRALRRLTALPTVRHLTRVL